ncbi:peptide chain release factor N(5)-glutamine methyltransferase [Halodurantibacterium flavum]|uniref:Release factor glutamine methyltransferase n=1 Tax=Halodurantibacterium flavum TaxID=1382802 RepID=A0ABW4S4M6_9RHOB
MRAADLLPAAIAQLRKAGVEGAPRDARILLAHALGIEADRLTLALHDPLPEGAADRFAAAVEARCRRQPVSQIIGWRDFFGRRFRVTPDVLDPRPETETLVAAALEQPFSRVLDLGTGSGAILLSLLAETDATGTGVDLSVPALEVARDNASRLGLEARAEFLVSDWFEDVSGRFDLVVSNPPYITITEMEKLSPEVRAWEPHLALTPGGDGLDAYRRIGARVREYLEPGGRLMVEIGAAQGADVAEIFKAAGLAGITILPDLDGRDRVVAAARGS